MSVATRYRESRAGRLHVHAARFVALLVMLSVTGVMGFQISVTLLEGGSILAGRSVITFAADFVELTLFAGHAMWLPAAILTAAWAGWEGVEP